MDFDLLIVGAGPGGIFSAYEAMKLNPELKIALFETGNPLENRKCPIDVVKIKSCINCKTCAIMNGFGGAGAFSDGKYNITNQFGGTLYEHIGRKEAIDLMNYVDEINVANGGQGTKLYTNENTHLKKKCMQNDLHLLEASVRHLGTDVNYIVLENLYNQLKDKIEIHFHTHIDAVEKLENGYRLVSRDKSFTGSKCIISTGRSGSKWMGSICKSLGIATKSNRVDIGVRVELPYSIFSDLTDELYESKIVYRTTKFQDKVRTFCMNPRGVVVSENTNGIVTVNGHSYDLIRGQRSTDSRIAESFVTPTLSATPGDLSLVIPKRQMDDIIEMIYALDKVAPGTANDDTLLYGVEVKFYNLEVEIDHNLETRHEGLYVIGDCSGVTHSLSHASASGVYVARHLYSNKH